MHASARLTLALALGLVLADAAQAQHGRPPMVYEVLSVSPQELFVFSPGASEARDINNEGEVVGWGTVGTYKHAFKQDLAGWTVDIGAAVTGHHSIAEGINDNSEVVGYRSGSYEYGFYWSEISGLVHLSNVDPPGVVDKHSYRGLAINAYGRIVGRLTKDASYDSLPVTWWHRSANPAVIYPLSSSSGAAATDVSDSGWMVGQEEGLGYTGFRYRLGTLEYPTDPSPPSRNETANSVNEDGTVVGSTWYSTYGQRAVRWRRTGTPLILGLLPGGHDSEAFDINETEFVVGDSNRTVSRDSGLVDRAFLFHIEFGMIELPPPVGNGYTSFSVCHANALNDRKANGLIQVVGYCTRNGEKHAMRWDVIVGERPD